MWALGILGVVLSAFMYGSNNLPVKQHETHDGVLFLWYQSAGMLTVGACIAIGIDWNTAGGINIPWEGELINFIHISLQFLFFFCR